MTIDPREAETSLQEIAAVEQRTREALLYARSSTNLMLWGALCVFGYLFTYLDPNHARPAWIVVAMAGLAGTFLSGHWRVRPHRGAAVGRPPMYARFALIAYDVVLPVLLGPVSGRQMGAFWPAVFG